MKAHVYHMDFGNGITCTATFEKPPAKGKGCVHGMEWSRKPNPEEYKRIAPQYAQWITGVREELATRWNMSMIALLNAECDRTEIWKFVPNQPAELLEILSCNLPF